MAQNEYTVEERSFRTEADYRKALRDKETIDRLRRESAGYTGAGLQQLRDDIHNGKYKFYTLLGQDFEDELAERIRQSQRQGGKAKTGRERGRPGGKAGKTDRKLSGKKPKQPAQTTQVS